MLVINNQCLYCETMTSHPRSCSKQVDNIVSSDSDCNRQEDTRVRSLNLQQTFSQTFLNHHIHIMVAIIKNSGVVFACLFPYLSLYECVLVELNNSAFYKVILRVSNVNLFSSI